MILSFFLIFPHLPFSASRVSTKLSLISVNRIPTWDEVVMNLKCYKSVIPAGLLGGRMAALNAYHDQGYSNPIGRV
jgi:hypothetical protein